MNPKSGQGSLERGERRNIDMRRDEVPSFHLRRRNGRDVTFLVLVEQMVDRQRMPKENKPKADTIARLGFIGRLRILDGAAISFLKRKQLASQKGAGATTYQMRQEQLKERDLVRVKQSGTMPRDDDMVTKQVP